MPESVRIPATGVDAGVAITRSVTHHRIGVRLVFDDRLDVDRLRRAAQLTLVAEPMLATAFDLTRFRPAWVRLPDADALPVLDVVQASDATAVIDAFQAEELSDAGPQVKLLFVQTASGDNVAIKVSHVLADGQAAKRVAYLLASIYTRLAEDPDYVPAANTRPRPSGHDVWNGLNADQRTAAKKAASFTQPTWVMPFSSMGGHGIRFLTRSLSHAAFRAIKARGQRLGATVNDMLLTAAFRACEREFNPEPGVRHSMMCTADLRRYLPDPESLPVSNISISGSLDIERVEGESFDEALARVHDRMQAWAATCYGAAPVRQTEQLAKMGYGFSKMLVGSALKMASKSGKTYPFFTNIGVLDSERLHFGDLTPTRAYMYGPSAGGPGVVFVVSTYSDELTICMGFDAEDADAAIIERVFDDTISELEAIASATPATE